MNTINFVKGIRAIAVILFTMLITGCGGGGGGGSGDNVSGESLTSMGYPMVAGSYSFTTDDISASCTDGSSATINKLSFNLNITQTENNITVRNATFGNGIPGITILETTDATGTVQKNGDAVVTQFTTAKIDGISGNVTVTYTVDCKFTDYGWSGIYEYDVFLQAYNESCTYTTSFNGDKIGAASSAIAGITIPDTHDDTRPVLGALLGF